MVNWNKMKSDISRGLKEGAETVAKKTGEVSAEGQKKVKIFNLKRKIQDYMEDLGVAIYNAELKTPGYVTDETAKEAIEKIREANNRLKDLESQ